MKIWKLSLKTNFEYWYQVLTSLSSVEWVSGGNSLNLSGQCRVLENVEIVDRVHAPPEHCLLFDVNTGVNTAALPDVKQTTCGNKISNINNPQIFWVVSAGIDENFSPLYAFSSIHSTIGNHLHVHCKQCSCNYSQFSNEKSLLNDFGANLIWGQFKVWGESFIPTIKTSFKAIKLQSEIKFSQSLPILTIPGRPSARVRRNKMRSRVLNVLLIMVSDNYFWNMKTDGEWDE